MDSITYLLSAFIAIFSTSKIIELYYKHKSLAIEKEKLRIDKLKAHARALNIIEKEEFLKFKGKKIEDKDAFEVYCSRLLSAMGFENIEFAPFVADGGKDVIATKKGEKYYIECKLWDWELENHHVERPEIQKLVGAMYRDGIKKGKLITSAYFSNEALEYASGLPKEIEIELINGDDFMLILRNLRKEWIPIMIDENLTPALQ